MLTAEEHKAQLHKLMREEHEGYIAEIRSRAEEAEREGHLELARLHWDQVARLEAMNKPWEGTMAA